MNPYFEQTILNADPMELIRLLYRRAIAGVRNAREHLRQKNIAERSAAIMLAYRAIAELLGALRPEVAPELCERLQGLYLYMQQRLLDANVSQSDAPLAEVLGLLTTLEEAWSGAAAQLSAQLSARALEGAEGAMPEKAGVEAPRGRWLSAEPGYDHGGRLAVSA